MEYRTVPYICGWLLRIVLLFCTLSMRVKGQPRSRMTPHAVVLLLYCTRNNCSVYNCTVLSLFALHYSGALLRNTISVIQLINKVQYDDVVTSRPVTSSPRTEFFEALIRSLGGVG